MRIDIHPQARILGGLWLDGRGKLSIGAHSVINQRCRLDNRGGLIIGANVSISPEVHVLTADHDVYAIDFKGREKAVLIDDYVFVGSRAIILPGVTLGKGCAVGAGAVVARNVAPYTVVAGNPAREIGKRPQTLDYVLQGKRRFL